MALWPSASWPRAATVRAPRATQTAPLDNLTGRTATHALSVNADGSVIVGVADATNGSMDDLPFIWTSASGMVDLQSLIPAALIPSGWRLRTAQGISADGTVITGNGINPDGIAEAWRVVLGPECATP
jgi:probable HAF family extracellular repeat protein